MEQQLLIGNLGSIELIPTVLLILGLFIFLYLFWVYTDWRFKKIFGCTWKNVFIFDVRMPSVEYGNEASEVNLYDDGKYRLSYYFTLQNNIVFEEGLWFSAGTFKLPFIMFLGVLGRPYVNLDINAEYEVLSKEERGLELALAGKEVCLIEETKIPLTFKKVEKPSLGWIYITRYYKEKFEDIEVGDKVRFAFNEKREFKIEKITN